MAKKKKSKSRSQAKKTQEPVRPADDVQGEGDTQIPEEETAKQDVEQSPIAPPTEEDKQKEEPASKGEEDPQEVQEDGGPAEITIDAPPGYETEEEPQEEADSTDIMNNEEDYLRVRSVPMSPDRTEDATDIEATYADDLIPQSSGSYSETQDDVASSSGVGHDTIDNDKKEDSNEATVEVPNEEDGDETKPLAESSTNVDEEEQTTVSEDTPEASDHTESAPMTELIQEKPTTENVEYRAEEESVTRSSTPLEPPIPAAETAPQTPIDSNADTVPEPVPEPAEAAETAETAEAPSTTELISSTAGPYTTSPLNISIPPPLGTPTAFCHYDESLFVGTSLGYILGYTALHDASPPEYVLISQVEFHPTRQFPIAQFVALPTLQLLLVVSGALLQCFSLPTPSLLSIGRIKDVEAVELDLSGRAKCDENGVHVVVITKTQIRVVNVTKAALRLVKDLKFGVKCGKRRVDKLVVAYEGMYEVLDMSRELNNRTSLFPVNTAGEGSLRPFVQGVGKEEFLLICGTGEEEPAMGMVVNMRGDVSRGTIPMEKYPEQVLTEDECVFTVVGGEVKLFSLEDQREVQSWSFSKGVRVGKVDGMMINVPALAELIALKPLCGGDEERSRKELEFAQKVSQVRASTMCFCEDFVHLLVPQSRLQRLEKVTQLRALEKELASSQATTELTVIEVEYLNLEISLMRLLEHQYDAAIEAWTNGTLDPRILIYAFNYKIHGDVYVFSGLFALVEKLKRTIKETALMNFFELFLERWLSKHTVENDDIMSTLELTSVLYNIDNHTQLMQTLKSVTHIDVFPILEEKNKHIALAHLYSEDHPEKAIGIYKDLVDNKISDQGYDKSDTLHLICELGKRCDDDVRRDTGMWLLKHDGKLAISFMNSSKLSLRTLQTGMSRTEEVKQVLGSIDDVGLKYEYLSQVFVSMGQEKMKLGLKKGLYKSMLKTLSTNEKKMRGV